jgi:hypothetical protein
MYSIPILSQTEKEQLEYFSDDYDLFCAFQGEPTVINVHRVWFQSIPDASGVEYETINFTPIENICIFSKTQAIQELFRLHAKYETDEYQTEEYDICLSRCYGKHHSCPTPDL